MILVTGATGTVGGEVLRRLRAAGERTRAFVRDPSRLQPSQEVEVVTGDLDRPETIEPALSAVDRVLLVTRQSARQVEQEEALVRVAADAGVRRVVKLSVFRADEQSPLRIARQHAQAERAVQGSNLSYTFLRPTFFMQNLLAMARSGTIRTAAADGRVAMIDSRDIAAVAVAALTGDGHEGRTYTLTGPQAVTFDEVADVLSREAQPTAHVPVGPADVRGGFERIGAEPWFAQDMATLHSMLATGYEDVVTDDVQTATRAPAHSLARFAHDHAEVFRQGA